MIPETAINNANCEILADTRTARQHFACPLCQTEEAKLLHKSDGKFLMKCTECGSIHLLPQPAPGELSAHFQTVTLDEREWKKKFEANRRGVLSKVARCIHTRFPHGGSILDVGCATGLFLSEFFKKANWKSQAVELSPAAADIAQKQGVKVFRGTVREAGLADNAFDAITMLDAFYYLADPAAELAEFHRVLSPRGVLVLELPLATTRIWKMSNRLGKLMSGSRASVLEASDHLFYYTPQSATRLLQRCGFAVENVIALPANTQPTRIKNVTVSVYSALTVLISRCLRGLWFIAPRYLIVATKI